MYSNIKISDAVSIDIESSMQNVSMYVQIELVLN